MIDRRRFVGGGLAGLAAATLFPNLSFAAAPTDRRFVFLIQRGAADGLHILAPTGDPAFVSLRGDLQPTLQGGKAIDSFFTLHPALARIGQMHDAGQAQFVHAAASAYRDRSHFDGQNILETGGRQAYAERSGWMNRLIGILPASEAKGIAIASAVPMAMRGDAQVATYAPSNLQSASSDLMTRVSALYASDAQLAQLWQNALATQKLTGDIAADNGRNAAALGALAAKLLAPADGARIMMIESEGWDTHSGQAGRMTAQLKGLDALAGALADDLGSTWNDTLLLVATEFGRTAAINGTGGTDHGTGSLVMLMGGALAAKRNVHADWPGLGSDALLDGRDLRPTIATEAVICGALARHFALDPVRVAQALYPAQVGLKPALV